MFKKYILVLLIGIIAFTGYQVFAATEDSEPVDLFGFTNILPFIDSNRYTHEKTSDVVVSKEVNEDYTPFTTDVGTVYIDEKSLAFQFDNDGYLYSSAPDITDMDFPVSVIYSMQSALNIQSYNMKNINYAVVRENLYTMGTTLSITYLDSGFEATVTFGTSKIKMNLIVTFTEDSFEVEVPLTSIVENDNYKLKAVQVYKDFGSVYEDTVPGYVFIPDGVGALVDYSSEDLGTPNYKKLVYGSSLGYNTEDNLNNLSSDGNRIYVPVFGFVHGVEQNAIFANITSGDEYASINMYYPSRNRGYTTVFSEFVYRQTYSQPIDQIGNTITLLQEDINPVDINISYSILSGEDASYVGMAKTYHEYLLEENAHVQDDITSTPLLLSFLGSENAPGVLWTNNIELSTLEGILEVVKELNSTLDPSLTVSIEGFTSKGVSWSGPVYKRLDNSFGSTSELEELSTLVDSLFMVTDHMLAPSSGSGYSEYTDLAKKINDQLYTYLDKTSDYNLLDNSVIESSFTESLHMFDEVSVHHAYRSFGSILYSDFSNDLTLGDQITLLQELLASLDTEVALYDVNSYLWPYIDVMMDTPMYSSQYVSFDDTVPFIPIALSNIVDLYSPSTTFLPYVRDDLLRMVDFHIYPSFIVTTEYTTELQKTNLAHIYVSDYDVISPMISTYYEFLDDALNQTLNAEIISREVVKNGVIVVGYSNGIEIIVNYTDKVVDVLGTTVDSKAYEVGDFQ